MKLILDTDPGIDDAMTYFYAHANPDIDLVAMTTVFGNVTVEDATHNALWLAQMSGSDAKVYAGSGRPLSIPANAPSAAVHGDHGFGDMAVQQVSRSAESESAAAFMVKAAQAEPGVLTLCAIGPLTNVAKAIVLDPNFVGNLAQLVIMGGSLDAGGNVTQHAEANFWNDPHAANIVLNAPGAGRIVVVGLDVTQKISFGPQDFEDLAQAAPQAGGFLRDIGAFYMNFYATRYGEALCHLHDPAALIAAERPDLFEMESHPLEVLTDGPQIGKMQRRSAGGRTCEVSMGLKIEAVRELYKRIVATNP